MAADKNTTAKSPKPPKPRKPKAPLSSSDRGKMPPAPGNKARGRPKGAQTVNKKPTFEQVLAHEQREPGDPPVHPKLRYGEGLPVRTRGGSIESFIPTDDMRASVVDFKVVGLTNKEIAYMLHITTTCLEKHFMAELVRAVPAVNAQIAGGVRRRAMAGDQKAAEFWLRTQGGFRNADGDDKENGVKTITVIGGLD